MPERPGSASNRRNAAAHAATNVPSGKPPDEEVQDQTLVDAITRGEQGAWRLLLGRHQTNIYNLCVRLVGNRELAEDLAQDTLVKLVQNIGRFDGRAKFSTWLYRITMNVCLSRLRAEKVRKHSSLDDQPRDDGPTAAAMLQGREPTSGQGVLTDERQQHILAALESLDTEQRSILLLRDTRDLDYDQIAEVLEVPVGTVKSRLFRARAALREALERIESGEMPEVED